MDIGRMFLKRNVWWQKHWWLDSFQNGFRYSLNPKDFTSMKFVYQHVIWSFFSFFFIKGPRKAFIHLPNEKGLWILQGTHFTASWMKMERNEVDTSDGLKTWMHINKDMGIRKSGDMQNFTNNDQKTMTSFGGIKRIKRVCPISYFDITFRYEGDDMKKAALSSFFSFLNRARIHTQESREETKWKKE